jgi:hypothetical protein
MERREINIRCESEFASLREKIKGPSEREWPLGRVCVCVTTKPPGLRRRGVQGVTLRHPVGPARAGHLEVGGSLLACDALPEGGGAPRRGVLSSEVDRLSGPV